MTKEVYHATLARMDPGAFNSRRTTLERTVGASSHTAQVTALPRFVLVDAETGELITEDGRSSVERDPKGEKFPWKIPSFEEALPSQFHKGQDEGDEWDEWEVLTCKSGKILILDGTSGLISLSKEFIPK